MEIKDNHSYHIEVFSTAYPKLYQKLTNKTLQELATNEHLLIFPQQFADSDDLEDKNMVLEQINHQLKTGNIVGFIGCGEEKLTIRSRFSMGEDDYFLHYLLQKVLKLNLVDLSLDFSFEDSLYNLLLYLFPKYLSDALAVGIYKEYRQFQFNDNRVKGTINIARHIKENTPFQGTIAYDTRQMTYDNSVLHLIRHTIEVLGKTEQGRRLLASDDMVKKQVEVIRDHTPTYQASQGQTIIKNNKRRSVRHAYYKPYRQLQQLCLLILARQKHDFKKSPNQIYGILFDVSWLWEDYLNGLLPSEFIHSDNRKKRNGLSLFLDHKRTVYPDFYIKNGQLVLDAKYKKLESSEKGISRDDLYQLITYAHIFQAKEAGLIYPSIDKTGQKSLIGKLNGYGGQLFKVSLQIPQGSQTFELFQFQMAASEKQFITIVYGLVTDGIDQNVGAEVR
ncbi:3-isopropylmalate dehydrogenase [Streptococcus hillyeri]|uniref:3-isopropylmalate dehydrogenase n=1 Tax=Streptococcus hillyeri TaxID=2282420 RepID=A0A3L9DM83_9STRE|nr:3-isopropylmalate dehydrogenase [Streptococcus hillyeri]RLY02411.1 3-isopropylmalate dehydrogenase [Streptococcus hillyeri]